MPASILKTLTKRKLSPEMIRMALGAEIIARKLPSFGEEFKSLRHAATLAYKTVYRAFRQPSRTVWTSIFTPSEIFHAMGLIPLCLEYIAAAAAAIGLAPRILSEAESLGLSATACSFHRGLIGSVMAGALPKPVAVVATSNLCDGNARSFEIVADLVGAPYFFIDVPYDGTTADAAEYLAGQLNSLVSGIEKATGRPMKPEELREAVKRSATMIDRMKEVYQLRKAVDLPGTRAMLLFYLSHVMPGSREGIEIYDRISRELRQKVISGRRKRGRTRLLWLHLTPTYPSEIGKILDDGTRATVVFEEVNYVPEVSMDPTAPLTSIARRILVNPLAGPVERRKEAIKKYATDFRIHGAVHFSHWGCRQSSGGVRVIKDALNRMNVHLLNIDGDCVDPRAAGQGQMQTRAEGFLEMLESIVGGDENQASLNTLPS